MKILLIAATSFEIEPFLSISNKNPCLDILVTGVGMTATAFALGQKLGENSYDLLLNAGIAGCFDYTVALGTVFNITHDSFSELGAEDKENFLPVDKLGFGQAAYQASCDLKIKALNQLPKAASITVNTVHGNEHSIEKIKRLFPQAVVESMEGAAVFYGAQMTQIPVIQIRSISNYVEERNKDNWNIPLAIKNLHTQLHLILNELCKTPC